MKHKLTKRAAYKFQTLADGESRKMDIEQGYVQAFQKGYSVVEIARLAGVKSAKFIHAALVKKGAISAGKPGRQPKGSIPKKMRIHLTTRGLTYSQWCAGWGFDQVEAKNEVEEGSGAAMAAIKQDFPGYYKLLTGVVVDDFVRPAAFEKQISSAKIDWDVKEGCYRAVISPSESIGYGASLQDALRSAQVGSWTAEILRRLEDLPAKSDAEREAIW